MPTNMFQSLLISILTTVEWLDPITGRSVPMGKVDHPSGGLHLPLPPNLTEVALRTVK